MAESVIKKNPPDERLFLSNMTKFSVNRQSDGRISLSFTPASTGQISQVVIASSYIRVDLAGGGSKQVTLT